MLPPRALLFGAALLLAISPRAAGQTCPQLSGVYSAVMLGTTSGGSADSASCGGGGAPEQTVFYTAPRAGSYVIDTLGAEFDTVLYVRSGATELACNDDLDPPATRQSRVSVGLMQGQMIAIVVDGFAGESGAFVLRINGNCPLPGHDDPRDLGSPASLAVSGSTANCASFLAGGAGCGNGGDNAPDAVFLYTAPFAGDFVVDTIGSAYNTILAVRDQTCTGAALGCNDDIDPQGNQQSRLDIALAAGQTVLIAVDGFDTASGAFTLHINGTQATPTATLTRTPTHTRTPTVTGTATRSATATRTATGTRTASRTATASATITATRSATPTRTATVTRTATRSQTATATTVPTVSSTPTRTGTATATGTATPSWTRTSTTSPSATPSASAPPSATATATITATPSITGTPTFRPPNAPSDLTCRAELNTVGWVVHLGWADNSSNETEFHIERALGNAGFAEIATVPSNQTTYADGPLDGGIDASYRVRAHRHATGTFSDYSNTVACTTAGATPTAPGTATPSVTRTATPHRGGPALCRPTRLGGIACKIDFEHLPDGSVPRPLSDVIREQYRDAAGVRFPDGGWVVTPRAGTSSPDLALVNATSGGEQEFNAGPLRISFAGVQVKHLSLRAGLDQRISGVRPVLTAFDDTGTQSVTAVGSSFGDGPTRVDQLLEVRSPDFAIARVELLYGGDTPSARNAVEVIDDLVIELDGLPPCPTGADTDPPIVTIVSPFHGGVLNSRNLPEIRGVIEEGSAELTEVRAEIVGAAGSTSVDLGPYVAQDLSDPTRFTFALRNASLFDGDNDITVGAADRACPANRGAASVRVTFEAPPTDLNFYAFALEITQNVQDVLQVRALTTEVPDPSQFRPLPYGAAMPLVAGKLTAVRAYAGISDVPALVRGVPAELRIRRDGTEMRLIADPISIDPADTVHTGAGLLDVQHTLERKRANFLNGWYFILPLSLTEAGTIDAIELQVNPSDRLGPLECSGCNDAANMLAVANIPFRTAGQLAVKVLLARDTESRLEPNADAGVRTLCDSFHKTYPVREGCGSDPGSGVILASVPATYSSRRWVPSTDTGRILRDLACKAGGRGWRGDVYHENLTLVAQGGVLNQGFGQGLGGSGCAVSAEADWPTAAQEVAHTWLLCHLPCGNPPMLCSGVRRTDGQTGDEGFHTRRLTVLPRSAWDWMTYCDDYGDPPDFNNWVSAYVYRYLRGSFDRSAALGLASDALQQAPGEYLLVSGRIVNGMTAALDPLFRLTLDDPEPASEPGPYELALLDADDATLFARAFAAETLPAEAGLETFHESIPFAPGTHRLVLRRGAVTLAERVASANTPTVAIETPQDGESWAADEEHTIAWSADDADGDALAYVVQYSPDDGTTWQIVAADLVDSELTIAASQLAGGDRARVRVLASDGVHTAAAESETFQVARKEPRLSLSGVADGERVLPGTILALRADYVDLDGDVLADADFVWRSDASGVLGTGPQIDVAADALPPGQQVLSVAIPGKVGPPVTRSVAILRVPSAGEVTCPGDCDGDGTVLVNELVRGVRIALGEAVVDTCMVMDADRTGQVTVNELVIAVGKALDGC